MKFARVAAVLLPVVVLAGCGQQATPPGDRVAQAYFDGIATQTVRSLTKALAAAEPGSPAAAYATYLRASSQAATDGGDPVEQRAQTADRTPKGYRFCQASGSGKTCFEYTRITRADGKVAAFVVNGKPIADRLAVGSGGPVDFSGLDANATFLAAYETTASDDLLVAVRVESGAGVRLGKVEASYQAQAGGAVPSAHAFGPGSLAPGSSANYLFAFPRSQLGGSLTLSTAASAGGQAATAVLPVR